MFDSTTFTQDMLSNPTKLMKTVIDAMESTDSGAAVGINDPNNGFVMQMAANLSIFSKFSEKVDYVNGFFYPQRARNAEQLYPHLSEFDYIKLMASPATVPFVFAMSKDWIINNSKYYDSNYNKIEIPATSYFTMGDTVYSMYYPIEILVNRNTGAVTAYYDTSTSNNLHTLSSNMLRKVQQFTQNGINYFMITFDMYQFSRQVKTFTVPPESGFNKALAFDDQFYAVKVFTLGTDGVTWNELSYSLTQIYYDYKTPTAVLTILTDSSQVKISIPQIYFDNAQISQNVKVELYTTKGAVNYSLSLADVTGVTANFDTSSSIFAAPLTQMPTWMISPTTTEVVGGSNILSYSEIRDAIVNQRLDDRVAVTTPEIIEAGKKAGFDLTRVTDDLTERVYYASNVLTDSEGMVVPTFAGNILIANDSLTGDPSTIINFTDGYYTILPTTTFTISNNGLTCTPMTDGQVAAMAAMTTAQSVAELNKGTYVRQPFHITLLTSAKSPQALIYNLLSPAMTSLEFIAENPHSAPQISATSCVVNHLNNGTGGYQILLGMTRSSNITTAPASNFQVLLTCKTKTGLLVYLPATYSSTDSYGTDTWVISLATSYHITTDDYLTVMMRDGNDTLTPVEIALDQTFTILTSFTSSFDTTIPVDISLNALLPASFQTTSVVMAQQTLELSLGSNLSSQIYCGVNTSWGNDVYKTADTTIYYKTNSPIFQTTETGVINTRYNTTTHHVEVVELYHPNTTPANTDDLVVTTTANTVVPSSGTTTSFTVDDATGILVGMPARGTNIPVGSKVTGVNGNIVTLSTLITTAIPSGTAITVTNYHGLLRTAAAQTSAGVHITVGSTADLVVGQSVFGFDIPSGNTIASIDSTTTFSLTIPTTKVVASGTLLTIINTTTHGVVKVKAGDIVTDPTGAPIIVKDAQNQYLIPAILFDGRLFASNDLTDEKTVTTISQLLETYANQISNIDAGLIEDSKVFYKPARTMGYANFGIGGSQTINMSLELSFSVTLYVDIAVYNTQTLLTTISSSVMSTINSAIQKSYISVSDITEMLKDNLGSNVVAVEMGDISGRTGLRLVSLEDAGATPSIENLLSIQTDGTVMRSPNIAIKYLPKPDDSESSALTS